MTSPRRLPIPPAVLVLALLTIVPHGPVWAARARSKPATSTATPAVAPAATPRAPSPPTAVEVRVERVRPPRERYATLRFLKENRDFLRSRFDRLRETPTGHEAAAAPIDPRFLMYQHLLADVRTATDSLTAAEESRKRQELFASVTDLGQLEASSISWTGC